MTTKTDRTTQTLKHLTDQCVKCGLCLPYCPTYTLFENENESPRGRISLIQGLIEHELEPSQSLSDHLTHCLNCRNCETVCPANVQYGQIIDKGRALLPHSYRPLTQLIAVFTKSNRRFNLLAFLGALIPSPVLKLLPHQSPFTRGLRLLAGHPDTRKKATQTVDKKATFTLFTGCITGRMDAQLVADTHTLLSAINISYTTPKTQPCCGATSQHRGQLEAAARQAQHCATFAPPNTRQILSLDTGCSAQWMEHVSTSLQPPMSHADIGVFLRQHIQDFPELEDGHAERILLHVPCSQKNVLKAPESYLDLLKLIPNLDVSDTRAITGCCGAAGTAFLERPEIASKIGTPLIQHIKTGRYDMILSPNIGCSMHLRLALQDADINIKLMHPISYIALHLPGSQDQ